MFKLFSKKEKKEKLDQGLEKTKTSFFGKISKALVGKSTVDEDVLDEIEEILISSDVGVNTSIKIIKQLEARVKKDKFISQEELYGLLKEEVTDLFSSSGSEGIDAHFSSESKHPVVFLVVGVNGVGKTTSIGKLAHRFKSEKKTVLLGAADTFRAAAIDQLQIWADRVGVDIVRHSMGADPAAVAYETVQKAISKAYDVCIIDTAGRLHNKVNLMKELGKIHGVMDKLLPGAPHEVFLVLDASTGQNAIEQARQFSQVADISSLILTKLDGTAKGGVVIGISDEFQIPIRFIGVGEGLDDLQEFDSTIFLESLFDK